MWYDRVNFAREKSSSCICRIWRDQKESGTSVWQNHNIEAYLWVNPNCQFSTWIRIQSSGNVGCQAQRWSQNLPLCLHDLSSLLSSPTSTSSSSWRQGTETQVKSRISEAEPSPCPHLLLDNSRVKGPLSSSSSSSLWSSLSSLIGHYGIHCHQYRVDWSYLSN